MSESSKPERGSETAIKAVTILQALLANPTPIVPGAPSAGSSISPLGPHVFVNQQDAIKRLRHTLAELQTYLTAMLADLQSNETEIRQLRVRVEALSGPDSKQLLLTAFTRMQEQESKLAERDEAIDRLAERVRELVTKNEQLASKVATSSGEADELKSLVLQIARSLEATHQELHVSGLSVSGMAVFHALATTYAQIRARLHVGRVSLLGDA